LDIGVKSKVPGLSYECGRKVYFYPHGRIFRGGWTGDMRSRARRIGMLKYDLRVINGPESGVIGPSNDIKAYKTFLNGERKPNF